jgi:hypothetical protein
VGVDPSNIDGLNFSKDQLAQSADARAIAEWVTSHSGGEPDFDRFLDRIVDSEEIAAEAAFQREIEAISSKTRCARRTSRVLTLPIGDASCLKDNAPCGSASGAMQGSSSRMPPRQHTRRLKPRSALR